MLTGDPAAERLMQRMDALEFSQKSLTGEVERLRYERDTLAEEVRALAGVISELQEISGEMRQHLKAVDIMSSERASTPASTYYGGGRVGGGVYSNGSSIPPPPTIVDGVPGEPSLSNDVSNLNQIGHDRMAEGDFTGAQTAFRQYLEFSGNMTDRGDVYFWLGESYYVKGGYADAADAYIASLREAKNGQYAPEAMVKLAATARALGNTAMACQTLQNFPLEYPQAEASIREKAQIESQRSGCS